MRFDSAKAFQEIQDERRKLEPNLPPTPSMEWLESAKSIVFLLNSDETDFKDRYSPTWGAYVEGDRAEHRKETSYQFQLRKNTLLGHCSSDAR